MCVPPLDFESMHFNPFTMLKNTVTQDESDPDINFYNDINLQNNEADYFCPDEVRDKIHSFEQQPGYNNTFSLLHMNARSLNKNIENFKTLLSEINHEFKIMAITESWLCNEDFIGNSNFDIPNYSKISFERALDKSGGGICAYIHNSVPVKPRNDISNSTKDIENLFLECVNTNGKNTLVGIFYRPPKGDPKKFTDEIQKIYANISKENKKITILGDFNMDCLNSQQDKSIEDFYQNIFNNGMVPVINKPTRVTARTCTAIDNIFINSVFDSKFLPGIIKSDVSDHFPIFIVAKDIDMSKIKTYLLNKDIDSNNFY